MGYVAAVREDQLHGAANKLNNIITELKASDGRGNTEKQCARFLYDSEGMHVCIVRIQYV